MLNKYKSINFELVIHCLTTVCPEKNETKMFFIISPIKLRRNLVYHFLDKFPAKSCKQFQIYLNNVFTLPCEIWNAHRGCFTSETSEYIPTVASKFARFESNNVWEILQEKLYQTGITINVRQRHWWMASYRNNDVIQLADSILSRCFSLFKSVMHILYTFSCPHTVINWIQIWQIWRPQMRWDKFWSFFL